MPFTPYPMGPGLAFKALGGPSFSLIVFGFSQVAMDIEPLVRVVAGGCGVLLLLATAFRRPRTPA